jgi:predicted lysophospholipase L1 biosynthesis ABC-type transport system permease subunit
MSGLAQYVRYALRQLRKSPGFTAVAVASLALGIGANTAIFTLINELLLKSLPVRDPQTLVAFGQQYGGGVIDGLGPGPLDLFPYEFYKQIEGEHAAFDGVAAYASFPSRLSVRQAGISNGTATQAYGHLVSGNFFSLLGADMALGRLINPIGLYGVMTYNVVRRTNEIGVRMALGAQSSGVLWLVLKESLTLLGVGIVLGVPAALAATRLLQSQLFGIRSSDPVTVLSAVLIVAGTTMVAGYFPARRATRVDPMVALRYE